MRARWVLAVTAALLYLVVLPVDIALERASGWYAGGVVELVVFQLSLLATFVVGWLLVLRSAGGVIGWLLLAHWSILVSAGLASTYAGFAYGTGRDLPGARAAAIYDTHGWPLLFAALVAIAFVVPDGHLPSKRWRPVAWLAPLFFTLTLVGGLTSSRPLDPPFDDVRPWGLLSDSVTGTLSSVGLLGMVVTLLLAAASLVVRYRRADLTARRQLKWIALAGLSAADRDHLGVPRPHRRLFGTDDLRARSSCCWSPCPSASASRCSATASTTSTRSSPRRSST